MNKKSLHTKSHLLLLIWKLFAILLLFSLTRLIFYLFNLHYYQELQSTEVLSIFYYGLRFDLAAVLIINLPIIILLAIPFRFRSKKKYLKIADIYFLIMNSLAIAVNLVDVIYFRFTFKRTTADIINYLSTGDDFAGLVPVFIRDFWYMFVIWIILIVILAWLTGRVSLTHIQSKVNNLQYYTFHSLIFIVCMLLTVIGIRGGIQLRPLSLMVAGKYTNAKNVPLVLNTPYTFLRTINNSLIDHKDYYKENELRKIYSPCQANYSDGSFIRKNVIIIIVESLSLEHIGSLNPSLEDGNYKGYTPFLDSLIRHSLVYKGFSNGKRSIEGIPAILSGIPALMNNAFIISPYSANNFNSIAGLLKEKTYSSAFFHGGTNGTMGLDNYSKMAGFDKYYGRNEYNNEEDFDGKWGIFDEEFLQYTADEITKTDTPFVAAIFTLSSHHPYTIPEKYKGRFKGGKLEIQKCIEYSDYSLKQFFERISHLPWYKNSLFVITADHTSESYYPYYKGSLGMYAIPIIFFDPDSNLRSIKNDVAQQIDILPSVLDYINYDNKFLAFGTSVFDTTASRFSVNYVNNQYQVIMDNYLLQFNGEKTTGFYNITDDSLLNNNLVNSETGIQYQMEKFTKAVIQQYNNRLIENKLTCR